MNRTKSPSAVKPAPAMKVTEGADKLPQGSRDETREQQGDASCEIK
jgi:hypothetical protein